MSGGLASRTQIVELASALLAGTPFLSFRQSLLWWHTSLRSMKNSTQEAPRCALKKRVLCAQVGFLHAHGLLELRPGLPGPAGSAQSSQILSLGLPARLNLGLTVRQVGTASSQAEAL